MLFLIYINDLPKNVTSTTRLFADDSLLYRNIGTTEDHRILQEDLSRLETWETDWPMSFNPLKCEVIRISKKRTQITGSYTIHGHQLATVKSGKYLGVTLTDSLSWNAHVDQATKKANNSLSFLRRNLYNCPSHTKAHAELPNLGQAHPGICLISLGSLHTVQHQQAGRCPTPRCKIRHRGLPHHKQCIGNDFQPRMGNPTRKTHRRT